MILKEKSVMASHLLSLVSVHAVASPNAICSAGANKKTNVVMEDRGKQGRDDSIKY